MQTLRKKLNQMRRQLVSRVTYAIDPQLIYGKESFYTETREAKLASARVTADLIMNHFAPKEVVDIGCGEGLFLHGLHQHGVTVLGCDISEAALKVAPKAFPIFQADATKPVRFNKTFDLCICVEIAEHIPTKYSKTLVKNVTQASDTVFFTAALPGQGGVGHINEQPHAFWEALFEAEGFTLDNALTQTLRTELEEANTLAWLWKNLLVFRRKPA